MPIFVLYALDRAGYIEQSEMIGALHDELSKPFRLA